LLDYIKYKYRVGGSGTFVYAVEKPGSWILPQQSYKPFFVVKSTEIGIYSVWSPYGRCIELYGWSFF